MKKVLKIFVFILMLCLLVIPTYATQPISDWEFYAYVELYNYELSEYYINQPVFRRFVWNDEIKKTVTEYISSSGLRVQSWNVPNDMNDLSNYSTFFREIPLEYDELYTVTGERVYADPMGDFNEGEYMYTFSTEDGTEVIRKAERLDDEKTGIDFPVYSYYRIDSLMQIDFESGYGETNSIYEIIPGTSVSIPECTFTREGYTFSHWTDGTANYTPGDTFIMPDHDVTMTAVWTENEPPVDDNPEVDNPPQEDEEDPPFCPPSMNFPFNFKDIFAHWAEKIIKFITEHGFMGGITDTEFCPNSPMTREMFITALARLADVKEDAISWAISNGLLTGYGNGNYGLKDTITREQMTVLITRYCDIMDIDLNSYKSVGGNFTFADDKYISSWAAPSVYKIYSVGLIRGKGNNLYDPRGMTTRAEAASVLYNLIQTIKD